MNELAMNREQRDMAVAIARDVLAQIHRADDLPLNLSGVTGYISGAIERSSFPNDGDLQKHVDEVQAHCTVCMLGACLLSKARLYDRVPMAPLFAYVSSGTIAAGRDEVTRGLIDVFDPETLDCLESAFEYQIMGDSETDRVRGAVVFGRNFDDPVDRAVAIMENLIANDGLFVVEPVAEEDFQEESDLSDEDWDDDDEDWDIDDRWDDEDDEDWDDDED